MYKKRGLKMLTEENKQKEDREKASVPRLPFLSLIKSARANQNQKKKVTGEIF